MSDEERIRAYLRGRADVPVPNDLRWPTAASGPRRRWAIWSASARAGLVVAGLVMAVVAVGVFLSLPTPTGPAHPSTPSASSSALPTSQPPDATFPSEVAGLPVISVANAVELLRSGKLDGQAIAVAGYYDEFTPSCPYPGRYIGPLESWCRFVAFTDTRASAQLCQPNGADGMSCSQPSGTNLAPFFMSETSGNAWSWLRGAPRASRPPWCSSATPATLGNGSAPLRPRPSARTPSSSTGLPGRRVTTFRRRLHRPATNSRARRSRPG